jgi:hypothetical protein
VVKLLRPHQPRKGLPLDARLVVGQVVALHLVVEGVGLLAPVVDQPVAVDEGALLALGGEANLDGTRRPGGNLTPDMRSRFRAALLGMHRI